MCNLTWMVLSRVRNYSTKYPLELTKTQYKVVGEIPKRQPSINKRREKETPTVFLLTCLLALILQKTFVHFGENSHIFFMYGGNWVSIPTLGATVLCIGATALHKEYN